MRRLESHAFASGPLPGHKVVRRVSPAAMLKGAMKKGAPGSVLILWQKLGPAQVDARRQMGARGCVGCRVQVHVHRGGQIPFRFPQ